jgi:DNA-binding Xre family transcriptional regulator
MAYLSHEFGLTALVNKFRVRRLRFEIQQKEERAISVQEVANAVGLDRVRLNKIELGSVREIKPREFEVLCSFYSSRLGRTINTNDILAYEPNNKPASELAGLAA